LKQTKLSSPSSRGGLFLGGIEVELGLVAIAAALAGQGVGLHLLADQGAEVLASGLAVETLAGHRLLSWRRRGGAKWGLGVLGNLRLWIHQ
jgi:hypothetical protein